MIDMMLFHSDGVSSDHLVDNHCYRVRDLIIDTRKRPVTFWHQEKRLVKDLNRNGYEIWRQDYLDDSLPSFQDVEVIDDTLFILHHDLNATSGHFFIDCLPKLWYYEHANLNRIARIGLVYPFPMGEPPYNPRQLLDLKYANRIFVLENNKVYKIKESIIPGSFAWWNDSNISPRFIEFIDSYFSCIKSDPEDYTKFYLSRQDIDYRLIPGKENWERRILVNELDLIEKLKPYGIVSKTLKPLTAEEFIRCFRNKEIVIGAEGSGWNYAMLASPKTKLVTIVHPRVNQFIKWLPSINRYKDFQLKFIYPKIEIYDRSFNASPNSHWKILNLDEVVNQIVS